MSIQDIIVISIFGFFVFFGILVLVLYVYTIKKEEYIEIESKVRTFRLKDGFKKIYLIEESDNKYTILDGDTIIKDLTMDRVKKMYKI